MDCKVYVADKYFVRYGVEAFEKLYNKCALCEYFFECREPEVGPGLGQPNIKEEVVNED